MTADFFVGLAESPFLPEITYCEPKIVLFLFTEHFLFTPGKLYTRCGHVVRNFESEAKTRCNFQF